MRSSTKIVEKEKTVLNKEERKPIKKKLQQVNDDEIIKIKEGLNSNRINKEIKELVIEKEEVVENNVEKEIKEEKIEIEIENVDNQNKEEKKSKYKRPVIPRKTVDDKIKLRYTSNNTTDEDYFSQKI